MDGSRMRVVKRESDCAMGCDRGSGQSRWWTFGSAGVTQRPTAQHSDGIPDSGGIDTRRGQQKAVCNYYDGGDGGLADSHVKGRRQGETT